MGAAIAALSDEALKIAVITAPANYIRSGKKYRSLLESVWLDSPS